MFKDDTAKKPAESVWAQKSSIVILLLGSLAWTGVFAQPITLTPEQQRLYDQLSPSERRAILESLGRTGASSTEGQLEFPETVLRPEELEESEQLEEVESEPRIKANDTIVIDLEVIEDIEPDSLLEITSDPRLVRLLGSYSYQLDKTGSLLLPGIATIPLAGLSAEEAAKRIDAEPLFRFLDSTVTILPLEPTGTAALEPFGYDLFEGVPTTFAPATDIPVPSDYVVGPGDTIRVLLFGTENQEVELTITRDGDLPLPEVGPVSVAGMRFVDLREELQKRIAERFIGVRASITLGALRSITVFVLGDATRPGSYTVSGLSTMTNALFVSGGIKEIGSLRDIQLKRHGRIVTRLDLYDLLIRGDTRGDARLQPGDVIFVPPIGRTAGIAGEVRRPAIYELREEKKIADLVALSGGLLPSAAIDEAHLDRITLQRRRTVLSLSLNTAAGLTTELRSGDVLTVRAVLDEHDDAVKLSGHVYRPGSYQWFPGMRLSNLISSVREMKPNADLNYVLIRRELASDRRIEVLSADLTRAWEQPGSEYDVPLVSRDEAFVFDLEVGRDSIIEPILEEIRLQSVHGRPAEQAVISGRVKAPGTYPLEANMRISGLIRAGGNLDEAAYVLDAELTRYAVVNGEFRKTDLIDVDLAAALKGDVHADILLEPYDYLNIKEIPEWSELKEVEIQGEVKFPGKYPIQRGETLGSVLRRAGGLTDLAFPEGAIFLRQALREREQEQKEVLANRLETDLAAISLQDQESREALSIGQALLTQLRETPATGRLVIDINEILLNPGDSEADITLRDMDELLIPKRTQEVTVLGEVQQGTSHIFRPGLSRDDYIGRSGGLTRRADKGRIYIVRASGEVITQRRSGWFARSRSGGVQPGDTIVVPLDADRVKPITFWTNVTSILFNLAIAAAAVNSF